MKCSSTVPAIFDGFYHANYAISVDGLALLNEFIKDQITDSKKKQSPWVLNGLSDTKVRSKYTWSRCSDTF